MLYRSGTAYGTVAGQVTDLSEQALYYCAGQRACNDGWWIDTGALTAVSAGVYNEECLPYSTTNFACNIGCGEQQNWVKNGSTGSLSAVSLNSWEAIKSHIVNYGPISVGFNIYSDFPGFPDSASPSFPASYVWPGTKTNNFLGGHAVMCYGFDDNMLNGQTPTSTGVLFCRNSWNTWWGNNGHFKIAYGADGIMAGNGDSYGFIWSPAPIAPAVVPTTAAPVKPTTPYVPPIVPTTVPVPVATTPAPVIATTTPAPVPVRTTARPTTTKKPVKHRRKLSSGNCQKKTTLVTCAPYPGTFINITSVFYGRDRVGRSSSFTGGCRTPNRKLYTSSVLCGGDRTARWKACNGYTTCSGAVNDATMGRTACAGNVWKLARVRYDCLPMESFKGAGAPRRFGGSRKIRAAKKN